MKERLFNWAPMRDTLTGTTRVVADDAAKWYWQSDKDNWELRDHHDFGPLRLPFPNMWVEFRTPIMQRVGGQWLKSLQHSVGVSLVSEPAVAPSFLPQFGKAWPPNGSAETIACRVTRTVPTVRLPVTLDLQAVCAVSQTGQFLSSMTLAMENAEKYVGQNYKAGPGINLASDVRAILWSDVKTALLAISLMNCKNTTLEHHAGTDFSRSSNARKRKQRQTLDFHTIKLPAPAKASRAQKMQASGGAIGLHQVRGHFKTYTPESPRFGRDTGTFWYEWHLRGNAENGVVISDYQVSPRK